MECVIAICLARLGMLALRQGDPRHAETLLLEGLARARVSGIRRWSRWYLVGLAEVARLRGNGHTCREADRRVRGSRQRAPALIMSLPCAMRSSGS